MDREGFPRPFGLRAWSRPVSHLARVNLGDSAVAPLTIQELASIGGVDTSELLPLDSPLGYGTSGGSQRLRDLLLSMYPGLGAENIMITTGAGEALAALASILTTSGDHCIVQVPTHESIFAALERVRCGATLIPADSSKGELIGAIRPETKAAFVVSPHNPTGLVLDADTLRRFASHLSEIGAVLVVDEVYRGVGLGSDVQPSGATLSHNVISVGSLSKIYGLAGLRIGWVAGPAMIVEDVQNVQTYTSRCPSPTSEALARVALENRDALVRRSLSLVSDALVELDAVCSRYDSAIQLSQPQGGTVAFPSLAGVDVDAWCEELVANQGLLLAPGGACFGLPGRVRINLGAARSTWEEGLPVLDHAFEQTSEFSLSRRAKS
jgi:aspartate/methionine/tyrosine aminotransferase